MTRRGKIAAVSFIFLSMILMAFCDSVRGIFIPEFERTFGVTDKYMSVMLMACSMGYIICTYLGGLLCEKIGQKKVMILGYIFTTASLFMLSQTKNFPMLLIFLFFTNIGQSLICIAINTVIPIIVVSLQIILINTTHFFYGAGSTFMQRISGIILELGIDWRRIYFYISLYSLALLIIIIFIKIPNTAKVDSKAGINKKEFFTQKLSYFYMLGLGLYVFSETATNNWFINYMYKNYSFTKDRASIYLSLFFGTFTVGRLIGGFVVQRLGYFRVVLSSLTAAVILYMLGLLMGRSGMLMVSFSGFFFSITFPTVVLTVMKVYKNISSYAAGIIITVSSAISMILNFSFGFLNDSLGVGKTIYLIPVCLFISLIFLSLVNMETKEMLKAGNVKSV